MCHMSHISKIKYFETVDTDSACNRPKEEGGGTCRICIQGYGIRAICWGLKFHLKAIFCQKFGT